MFGKKINRRGITQKLRKGLQSFLCTTCHPELIQIPIQLHEDIPNDYLVMECIRIFEKNQSKGHNSETKKGGAIILVCDKSP